MFSLKEKFPDFVSHISSPLTQDDADLFIKAVSDKGKEAVAFFWYHYWFEHKANPNNIVAPHLLEKIDAAMFKNSKRLQKHWKQK
jgi:hypothetical protein